MLGKSAIPALAMLLFLQAVPAASKEDSPPLALKPASPWVMDYADDNCALRRTFGSAEQPVWLELREFAPGDEFLVTVATGSFKMIMRAPRTRFLPDGPLREQRLAAYGKYGDETKGVMYPDSLRPERGDQSGTLPAPWDPGERDKREAAVSGLRVSGSFNTEFVLQTGELHKPMQAMRACLDDLLTHWGIDPNTYRTQGQPPAPVEQARWAKPIQAFFPSGLLFLGINARVTFLLIDDLGKVTSCKVQRPVADKAYENRICGILLKQAKFSPALDASGKPTKGFYLLNVIYATR